MPILALAVSETVAGSPQSVIRIDSIPLVAPFHMFSVKKEPETMDSSPQSFQAFSGQPATSGRTPSSARGPLAGGRQITRNRASYSCHACRRRKVKCDKVSQYLYIKSLRMFEANDSLFLGASSMRELCENRSRMRV